MNRRVLIAVICVTALSNFGQVKAQPTSTDEEADFAARQDAWEDQLELREFWIPDESFTFLNQIGLRSHPDVRLEVTLDLQIFTAVDFTFTFKDRPPVKVRGHLYSTFTIVDDKVYFAEFFRESAGCKVRSFDLTTGQEIWTTTLHQPGPLGHSGYKNRVFCRESLSGEGSSKVAGEAIIVIGSESYCDYVEVLDRATGKMLAIRVYRDGVSQPDNDDARFLGRGNSGGRQDDNDGGRGAPLQGGRGGFGGRGR
jgi:hypothetical protein